ncbi:hypothetical protein PtB15_11B308 [Puccinia triticina]|nr:hypothetical protein PtB15_11B308 [Puccinia triticina]
MHRSLTHCRFPSTTKRKSVTGLTGTANGKLIHYPSPNQLGSQAFTHNVHPTLDQLTEVADVNVHRSQACVRERNTRSIKPEINPPEIIAALVHQRMLQYTHSINTSTNSPLEISYHEHHLHQALALAGPYNHHLPASFYDQLARLIGPTRDLYIDTLRGQNQQYTLNPEIPLFPASIPDEAAFLNLIEEGLNEEED